MILKKRKANAPNRGHQGEAPLSFVLKNTGRAKNISVIPLTIAAFYDLC
jgi:hypothetical protein